MYPVCMVKVLPTQVSMAPRLAQPAAVLPHSTAPNAIQARHQEFAKAAIVEAAAEEHQLGDILNLIQDSGLEGLSEEEQEAISDCQL